MVEYRVMNYCQKIVNNAPILYLNCRDKRGKFKQLFLKDESLRPEFYVRRDHFKLFEERFKDTDVYDYVLDTRDDDRPTIYHELSTVVRTRLPYDIKSLRNYFPVSYQADINWDKMAFNKAGLGEYIRVKRDIVGYVDLKDIEAIEDPGWTVAQRRLVFDIETASPAVEHVPEYKDATSGLVEVIVFAGIDTYTKKITVLRVGNTPLPTNVYENPLPTDIKERIGAKDTYEIEEHLFKTDAQLLGYLVNTYVHDMLPDVFVGHNIAGGNMLRPWGKREWKNGFDLPIILGTCKARSVDASPLSTIRRAEVREYRGKNEVIIEGTLIADWLYWWKYTHIGDSLFKIDANGKVLKLKNDRLGSIADISFNIKKLKPRCGMLDATPDIVDMLSTMSVGEQYKLAPHYTTLYCIHDAMLSFFLEEMYNIVDDLSAVPMLAGGKPEDAVYAQKFSDSYTLKMGGKLYRLPTKLYKENQSTPGTDIYGHRLFQRDWNDDVPKHGGYVPDVKEGYHEDVIVADFSRMYPRESQTANEGVDTRLFNTHLSIRKDGMWVVDHRKDDPAYRQDIPWEFRWKEVTVVPCVPEDSKALDWLVFYRNDMESVEKLIYTTLEVERSAMQKQAEEYKDRGGKFDPMYITYNGAQKARKYITNARIGVKGSPGERLNSNRQFNSITCSCRWLTSHVQSFVEHLGFRVLGGDTDSVFIKMNAKSSDRDEMESQMRTLIAAINVEIDRFVREEYQVKENYMSMGVEKLCSSMYIFAKKRYVGKVVWEEGKWLETPDILYRGIELRKRNTSYFNDQAQFAFVDLLLTKGDKSLQAARLLRALKHEFYMAPPTAVGEMSYLSKPLHKYNDIPRARAALTAQALWHKKFDTDEDFHVVHIHPTSRNFDKIPRKLVENDPVIAVSEELETRFFDDGLVVDYDKHWQVLHKSLEPFLEACNYVERLKGYMNSEGLTW